MGMYRQEVSQTQMTLRDLANKSKSMLTLTNKKEINKLGWIKSVIKERVDKKSIKLGGNEWKADLMMNLE